MKALILNSGMGSRMGALTSQHPKCMTEISHNETILSRQLRQLCQAGITEVVITTGLFDGVLVDYAGGVDFAFAWQGAERLRLSARVQDGTLICEVFAE